MGAAASTYAFGREDGLADRTNIKAMIAVQPLLYTCFVRALGMPSFMINAGEKVSQKRLGFDMSKPDFIRDAPKVNVPTLVVQNENDPWTEMGMVNDYYSALTVEKELRLLDLEKSRFAAYDYVGTHPEKLIDWFNSRMQ